MGDSQSRYSIVERLSEKKLSLIREKSQLDENIKAQEFAVKQAKKSIEDFKKDSKLEIEQRQRELARAKDLAENRLSNARLTKNAKLKSISEQIKSVDDALSRIEKVSEFAGSASP